MIRREESIPREKPPPDALKGQRVRGQSLLHHPTRLKSLRSAMAMELWIPVPRSLAQQDLKFKASKASLQTKQKKKTKIVVASIY